MSVVVNPPRTDCDCCDADRILFDRGVAVAVKSGRAYANGSQVNALGLEIVDRQGGDLSLFSGYYQSINIVVVYGVYDVDDPEYQSTWSHDTSVIHSGPPVVDTFEEIVGVSSDNSTPEPSLPKYVDPADIHWADCLVVVEGEIDPLLVKLRAVSNAAAADWSSGEGSIEELAGYITGVYLSPFGAYAAAQQGVFNSFWATRDDIRLVTALEIGDLPLPLETDVLKFTVETDAVEIDGTIKAQAAYVGTVGADAGSSGKETFSLHSGIEPETWDEIPFDAGGDFYYSVEIVPGTVDLWNIFVRE